MREADERELNEPPFEIVNGRKVYDMSFIVNSEFRSALPSPGRLGMGGAGPPDTPLLTLASSSPRVGIESLIPEPVETDQDSAKPKWRQK